LSRLDVDRAGEIPLERPITALSALHEADPDHSGTSLLSVSPDGKWLLWQTPGSYLACALDGSQTCRWPKTSPYNPDEIICQSDSRAWMGFTTRTTDYGEKVLVPEVYPLSSPQKSLLSPAGKGINYSQPLSYFIGRPVDSTIGGPIGFTRGGNL